jgi:hypothetical protein
MGKLGFPGGPGGPGAGGGGIIINAFIKFIIRGFFKF